MAAEVQAKTPNKLAFGVHQRDGTDLGVATTHSGVCVQVNGEKESANAMLDTMWPLIEKMGFGSVMVHPRPPALPKLLRHQESVRICPCRVTSLTRKRPPLGPHSRPMPRVLGGS